MNIPESIINKLHEFDTRAVLSFNSLEDFVRTYELVIERDILEFVYNEAEKYRVKEQKKVDKVTAVELGLKDDIANEEGKIAEIKTKNNSL